MKYLYEMHAHVKEVSTCSPTPATKLVEYYEGKGYTGIVLTDHMNAASFNKPALRDASWDEKVDHFLSGYKALKEAAQDKFKIILGMEINFYGCPNDYLVYGISEEFLRSNGDLMVYSPKEFSALAHENGLLFIQAHPFRRGLKVEDWKILDGYEIFNGNPRHWSSNEMAEAWAKFHNARIVTSGSDFHEFDDVAHGGMYFNKPIETPQELVEELNAGNYELKIIDLVHTRPE